MPTFPGFSPRAWRLKAVLPGAHLAPEGSRALIKEAGITGALSACGTNGSASISPKLRQGFLDTVAPSRRCEKLG